MCGKKWSLPSQNLRPLSSSLLSLFCILIAVIIIVGQTVKTEIGNDKFYIFYELKYTKQ